MLRENNTVFHYHFENRKMWMCAFNIAFTCRIEELESRIGMIDDVYFANMEQESELEWWGPPLFGNGRLILMGEGGNESPIPWIDHFALPQN